MHAFIHAQKPRLKNGVESIISKAPDTAASASQLAWPVNCDFRLISFLLLAGR
jgi:hypothetical protein